MHQSKQESRPAPEWDIAEARRIVLSKLEGQEAAVYLFGSAAEGRMNAGSDIDIAIQPKASLPTGLMAEIREALEQSNIIYKLDLVDLDTASDELRAKVIQKGRVWKD